MMFHSPVETAETPVFVELTHKILDAVALVEQVVDGIPNNANPELNAQTNLRGATNDVEWLKVYMRANCKLNDPRPSPRSFVRPGWNILLDLYIAAAESRPITITRACIASEVASTTALRHLDILQEMGLVDRVPTKRDARLVQLILTPKAVSLITSWLAQVRC